MVAVPARAVNQPGTVLRVITRLLHRSEALVLDGRVGVGKRASVLNRHVSGRGRVRSHDGLRALQRIRMAQRVEQRPIDQNRMAMFAAAPGRTTRACVAR